MTFDGKAFGAEIVGVVKQYVNDAVSPLAVRLDAMEKRLSDLPRPKDGKDADEEAVAARVSEKMADELAEMRGMIEALPSTPDMPDVAGIISEAVNAIDEQRAQDAAQLQAWMDGIDGKIAAIAPGRDGQDADSDEMRAAIASEVERAVSAIPAPQDGKSVTVEELRPLVEESVSAAVSALPKAKDGEPGKDGVGLAGALIDRDGNLVLTLTDGTTRDLGTVVGKDGERGTPGHDGFSLDDFDADLLDDGRTVLLSFEQGDIKHTIELQFPAMIYRGVFKEGQPYMKGDTVTWGGSLWHCDADETIEKPDSTEKHWTLAAKRGRDGKDGAMKAEELKEPLKVG